VNRTITIRATVRRVAASILATAFVLTSAPAHAEFVSSSLNNVLDTDTGLEWRRLYSLEKGAAYNAALGKYQAGSTYRLPTAAEVDNLLGKFFPGFVANDASGRCAVNLNSSQLAQAGVFRNMFGEGIHAMYQDASGRLRALFVATETYYPTMICLASDYLQQWGYFEDYRTTTPQNDFMRVLVVRDPVDVKIPVVTLYNYVHPSDIGLHTPFAPWGLEDGDTQWSTSWYDTYYGGDWTSFSLAASPLDFASGQVAPWVRLRSIDYTPFPNSGAACYSTDVNLGNGFCRHSFVGNYWPWHLTASTAVVPGSYVNNRGRVDNVVVEQIWENITVDYAPSTPNNTIRPKNPAESVYIVIKTTSIAAGDDYDINAAYIDPASLKLGANLAPVLNYQASDVDGDGDMDYTYEFNTGATGITCLDTRITLTGKTYYGVPMAGYDTVAPLGCTETIFMDVDPFNATNTIRPNDNYNVTVAILGMRTTSGDAVNLYPEYNGIADGLDRTSLKFGPAATPLVGTPVLTDIDGDANTDLLVNFNVFNAGIACGDTQVQLKGNKISGIPIMAVDNIVTTDCETGGCHP
jgi:hypothetical protein